MSRSLQLLLRLLRPVQLLVSALAYGLGLGAARYLGQGIDVGAAFSGGGFLLLVMASAFYLEAYFRPLAIPLLEQETRLERQALNRQLLFLGAGLLVPAAAFILVLHFGGALQSAPAVLIGLITLLSLSIALPPVRLAERGLEELVQAIVMAAIIPALAFALQSGEPNRLLSAFTYPLTLMAFACLLAAGFPIYAEDIKYDRRSLIVRLGWQRAISLHNFLLAAAYLLLALAPLWGLPLPLIWPGLLTVPLAAYQVYNLRNISEGVAPAWNVLLINAAAILGLTMYLITLTFWLR